MAADEKDSAEKAELNVTCQTSPEFLLSQGSIEGFTSDPISSLGRCSAAAIDPIPSLRGCSGTAPSFEPQAPFEPQVPEREVEVDMLQEGPGLQVLPAKKRTLSELDNEWDSHRESRGLHPYPYSTRLPGVDGQLTIDARGIADTQLGRGGILAGQPGMPGMVRNSHFGSTGGGSPGEHPAEFQQVMSPTCVNDSRTFGTGSASSEAK